MNSYGVPWTDSGFRASWRTELEEAKKVKPGLTAKGLRHTMATVLRENAHPLADIADALGHTEKMAAHYSRDADLRLTMVRVVTAFDDAETNRTRTAVGKPSA